MNQAKSKTNTTSASDEMDFLVVDQIERSIRQEFMGLLQAPGAKLPREEDLVNRYRASRNSVRSALARLKEEKLIHSIPGKGTFVSSHAASSQDVHIVCQNPEHPFSMMAARLLSSVLREKGMRAQLVVSTETGGEWEFIQKNSRQACGVLLVNFTTRKSVEEFCQSCSLPVVLLGDVQEDIRCYPPTCDNIIRDERAMGFRATDYLIRQGHRGVALLAFGLNTIAYRDRVEGYRDAYRLHGLKPDPAWIFDFPKLPFDLASHKEHLKTIQTQIDACFASENRPTALIHSMVSESQIRDILHLYFHDGFQDKDVVVITYRENLNSSYAGMRSATAVCSSYATIADRALELLLHTKKPDEPARREILELDHICKREGGIWKEVKERSCSSGRTAAAG